MGHPKYTAEFKNEAVNQVTEKGYSVVTVAKNLGISDVTLYAWIKKSGKTMGAVKQAQSIEAIEKENAKLRAEVRRLQEERDILKKSRGVLCERVPVKYSFIREHQTIFRIRPMCRTLRVHPSGYYKWLSCPESSRAKANNALTELIIEYWDESGRTYGSPRIHRDLRETGEVCHEEAEVHHFEAFDSRRQPS